MLRCLAPFFTGWIARCSSMLPFLLRILLTWFLHRYTPPLALHRGCASAVFCGSRFSSARLTFSSGSACARAHTLQLRRFTLFLQVISPALRGLLRCVYCCTTAAFGCLPRAFTVPPHITRTVPCLVPHTAPNHTTGTLHCRMRSLLPPAVLGSRFSRYYCGSLVLRLRFALTRGLPCRLRFGCVAAIRFALFCDTLPVLLQFTHHFFLPYWLLPHTQLPLWIFSHFYTPPAVTLAFAGLLRLFSRYHTGCCVLQRVLQHLHADGMPGSRFPYTRHHRFLDAWTIRCTRSRLPPPTPCYAHCRFIRCYITCSSFGLVYGLCGFAAHAPRCRAGCYTAVYTPPRCVLVPVTYAAMPARTLHIPHFGLLRLHGSTLVLPVCRTLYPHHLHTLRTRLVHHTTAWFRVTVHFTTTFTHVCCYAAPHSQFPFCGLFPFTTRFTHIPLHAFYTVLPGSAGLLHWITVYARFKVRRAC